MSEKASGTQKRDLTPLPHGADEAQQRTIYRDLFTEALEEAPIKHLSMALNQNQPIGNPSFYAQIEVMTGQHRELRKRWRPPKQKDGESVGDPALGKLPL